MPSIYEYLNYRTFLHDYFLVQKEQRRPLTHRMVLEKMGVSSTGFLSNVISGKKNLSNENCLMLAIALELGQREQTYFGNMVGYTQAKTLENKKEHLDRLLSMRRTKISMLSESQLYLFSRWYYVYIRDLLTFMDFKDDYAALSRMLDPCIRPDQARRAIQDLSAMGLIAKDENGFFRPTQKTVTTGDEVRSVQLANFQLETMDMAKRALEKYPAADRDISVVSMTLSPQGFSHVKSEIQAFRKKLLQIATEDNAPERVFQCNIQMFPVTKPQKGTK